jgi:hypothetical protein
MKQKKSACVHALVLYVLVMVPLEKTLCIDGLVNALYFPAVL